MVPYVNVTSSALTLSIRVLEEMRVSSSSRDGTAQLVLASRAANSQRTDFQILPRREH